MLEKSGRGEAVHAFEGAGEVKRVHAHSVGDLSNEETTGFEKTGRLVHFQTLQESVSGLSVKSREESAKVSDVDMTS